MLSSVKQGGAVESITAEYWMRDSVLIAGDSPDVCVCNVYDACCRSKAG